MSGKYSDGTKPPPSEFKAWRKRLRRLSKNAREKAQQNAEAMASASSKTSRSAPLSYRKRAPSVLKREAYDYYCRLEQAGQMDKLKAYIRERDGTRWDGNGDDDAHWVCRLFASNEQDNRRRKTRSRMATEMGLARANDVRPELYLGFLYEAGPYELIEAKMAKKNKVYGWAGAYRRPRSALNKPKA
jgi:hypothetical protein